MAKHPWRTSSRCVAVVAMPWTRMRLPHIGRDFYARPVPNYGEGQGEGQDRGGRTSNAGHNASDEYGKKEHPEN